MDKWINTFVSIAASTWKGFFAQAIHLNVLLALMSFIVGVLLIRASLREYNSAPNAKRLCGAFLLLALAFEANTPWVYMVSVFVVATLITELSFLSDLAAISWNRPWAIQRPASSDEIEKKLQVDEEESEAAEGGEPLPGIVQGITSEIPEIHASGAVSSPRRRGSSYASQFEKMVMEELERSGLFDELQLETAISAASAPNTPIAILDGVGFIGAKRFVIEIKLKLFDRKRVENQIRLGMIALANTPEMKRKLLRIPVRGIIITSAKEYDGDHLSSDIAVLYFDDNTREFTNLVSIRNWVRSA